MKELFLAEVEKKKVLNWFEYVQVDSQHYGDGISIFPSEQVITDILNHKKEGYFCFSESQIRIIYDWMQDSVRKNYGNAVYLLPEEKSVYNRINEMVRDMDKEK